MRPGAVFSSAPNVARTLTVSTSCGAVIGFSHPGGTCFHFRGVPYAASTGGANRFRPPQPMLPWTAPLACFRFGPAAHQLAKKSLGGLIGAPLEEDLGALGDDCLHATVVTPQPPPDGGAHAPLPVLVWIHGGANATGSSTQLGHLYPAEAFAARGVVCVSLNYRLAMHGFMHLPAQGVTNLALRDLIAGLKWVKDNIAAFGGDPSRVTLWGQSAGAVNAASLLVSPLARGLVQGAVLVSGGPCHWASKDEYGATGLKDFVAALRKVSPTIRLHESGEPLLEDVAALPSDALAGASAGLRDTLLADFGVCSLPPHFSSLPDGEVLPLDPSSALRSGAAAGVPLLLGSGMREMSDFARFIGGSLLGAPGAWLAGVAVNWRGIMAPEPLLRALAGRVPRTRLPDAAARTACDSLSAALGGGVASLVDFLSTSDARTFAADQARHAPVHAFEVELTRKESPLAGSGHGIDLGLLFAGDLGPGFTAEQRKQAVRPFFARDALGEPVEQVANSLRDAIIRFATSGSPPTMLNSTAAWPPFDATEGRMVFATTPRFLCEPAGRTRGALLTVAIAGLPLLHIEDK